MQITRLSNRMEVVISCDRCISSAKALHTKEQKLERLSRGVWLSLYRERQVDSHNLILTLSPCSWEIISLKSYFMRGVLGGKAHMYCGMAEPNDTIHLLQILTMREMHILGAVVCSPLDLLEDPVKSAHHLSK